MDRIVSREEIEKQDDGYYIDLMEFCDIVRPDGVFIVEDSHGTWRFIENGLTSYLRGMLSDNKIYDLNKMRLDSFDNKFTTREYIWYYMDMGYSLCGYYEVWGDCIDKVLGVRRDGETGEEYMREEFPDLSFLDEGGTSYPMPKPKKLIETSWVFIVDTDQYAGNFEREMTAYCTGVVGQCGVGEEAKELFMQDYSEDFSWEMCEKMEQRADDNGCLRPSSIWRSKNKDNYKNDSVAMFFNEELSSKIIEMITTRAEQFTNTLDGIMKKKRTMKILGFRIQKEEKFVTETEIQ